MFLSCLTNTSIQNSQEFPVITLSDSPKTPRSKADREAVRLKREEERRLKNEQKMKAKVSEPVFGTGKELTKFHPENRVYFRLSESVWSKRSVERRSVSKSE